MAEKNPYCLRGMIPVESEMFFGREKEKRRITNLLAGDTPQCVSIIGERRIGKSSLAARVLHEIRQEPNTLAVYLDCDGLPEECQSKNAFFQLLNNKFLETAEQLPGASGFADNVDRGKKKLFDNYSSFRAFVGESGRKGMKTIICLDEFEHLPNEAKKNKNAFADNTFFSNLRAMANNPANRLAFVAISKTNLKKLTHRSVQSSGFWNIFSAETVGLLAAKGIESLRKYGFEKTGYLLTAEEIEKIHYYAGDFPFFNQMVCGFLWDAKTDGEEPAWDDVEVELLPFYEKLWEGLTREEQKLLQNLKSKENISLKKMKSRGVIIKEEERFLTFSDFLAKLIKKKVLKINRKKIPFKKIFDNIKEFLGIAKSTKDLITKKGD